MSGALNQLIARQRALYPIEKSEVQWEIKTCPPDKYVNRERWEAVASHKTGYRGWAIQPTEEEARAKAYARLIYARDYGLERHFDFD